MLTVFVGRSTVPVRPLLDDDDALLPPFVPAESAPPLATTQLEPGEHYWRIARGLATGVTALHIGNDQGEESIDETGTAVLRDTAETFGCRGNDPPSAGGGTPAERGLRAERRSARMTTR